MRRKAWVWVASGVVWTIVVAQLWSLAREGNRHFAPDFFEYWAAGRLALGGRNPYDPASLSALQSPFLPAGAKPIVMYNPPWTLAVLIPFGALPLHLARVLWVVSMFVVLVVATIILWRAYGGPDGRGNWALVAAAGFFPCFLVLAMGQATHLVLLGLVGFLTLEARGHPIMAGGCAALAAIKPQLIFLFWPALLVWVVTYRRWGVLLGLAAGLLAASGIALMFDRDVFDQYLTLMSESPPAHFRSTTIGTWLRLSFGWDHFWLQYVPPLAGLAWLAALLVRHWRSWTWTDQLPIVVLVSILTAAYGSWMFDLVVALPAVLRVTADFARVGFARAATPYLAANLLAAIAWFGIVYSDEEQKHVLIVFNVLLVAAYGWWVHRRGNPRIRRPENFLGV